MSTRCPGPEELIELLDRDGGGPELRRHAAGCAACRDALAALRESFEALVPAAAITPDAATLARIEEAVLEGVAQPLAARERAAQPTLRRLVAGGALGVLLVATGIGLWHGMLAHPLASPLRGLALALLPLPLFLALHLGRRGRTLALGAGLALGGLLPLLDLEGAVVPLLRGLPCLLLCASGALLPAALLWWLSGTGRWGLLGGALVGAASWVGGLAVQTAVCTLGGAAHVAAIHLGPFLLGTTAFALLGWRAAAGGLVAIEATGARAGK